MKKYIKYSSLIFAGLTLFSGVAHAAMQSTSMPAKPTSDKVVAEKAVNTPEDNKMQTEINKKRQEFIKSLIAKREEVKTKIKAEKDQLKASLLASIKSEAKRKLVDSINTKIQDLNTKATDRLSSKVDDLEMTLVNIESRIDKAAANGIDVSAVRVNDLKAMQVIADAKSAILTQTAKVYSINITNEQGLKQVVQKARDAIYNDLKLLNDKVNMAKNAVKASADLLASIPNIDNLKNSSY